MTTPDTAAIRARTEALKSSGWPSYHAAAPDMHATILTLCDAQDAGAAREAALLAEVGRLKTLLNIRGTGPAERYWEGRWRDEAAENDKLRAALKPFAACADILDEETANTKREFPGDEWVKFRLLVSDYRHARAALAQNGDE